MSSRRSGFTLLEICLALLIGLLLILLAVPSIGGMVAEQRLKRSFEAFDALVRLAKSKSVTERRAYEMVWDEEGITLLSPEKRDDDDPDAEAERFAFAAKESFAVERPAALMKDPPMTWTFWRSGVCEPAIISFRGEAGHWTVRYDPLTARGIFLESEVK